MDVNSSISLLSYIHSTTADFVIKNLKKEGFQDFASSHGNILFQLSLKEKMSMGHLSKLINRDKSTTTVLVRKLEQEGLVLSEPDPNDKRSKNICLTEKGKEFNQATSDISKELLTTFYKGFSDQEKEEFFNYLKRIRDNFK
ncbi:MAG: MarR family transcriptional regulator [Treponema sp.]|nr:MarR family transcriptional regulator [Treponema sp.]